MFAAVGDGEAGGEVAVPPDVAALVDVDVDQNAEEHRSNFPVLQVVEELEPVLKGFCPLPVLNSIPSDERPWDLFVASQATFAVTRSFLSYSVRLGTARDLGFETRVNPKRENVPGSDVSE